MTSADTKTFVIPPVIHKTDGSIRRVGFELEFSGLTMEQTLRALQTALGGTVEPRTIAEHDLHVDDLGSFAIELDWEFLKRTAKQYREEDDMAVWIDRLSQAAALFVPVEVVCPPIAITAIHQLNTMVSELHKAGAVGTEESLIAAYGVHINPEIPSLDAKTVHAYLQAYALLQWWLVEAHDVNPTRKISPYIDLYSRSYVVHLLHQREPSIDDIIQDYLAFNPSRNRALDMLPMFAEINEQLVRSVVDDSKINARPTFHYRLPNCHIDQSDWSLAESWNHWVVVEKLVQQPQLLRRLGESFLSANLPVVGVDRAEWVTYLDQCLQDHALV